MMKWLLLFSLTAFPIGQSYGQISSRDSLMILHHWNHFVEVIKRHNLAEFKNLSSETIFCSYCSFYLSKSNPTESSHSFPVDTFFVKYFGRIFDEQMMKVIGSDKPWISELKNRNKFNERLFEIIYLKYQSPLEHENLTVFFEFAETENGLKFYGYDTSP